MQGLSFPWGLILGALISWGIDPRGIDPLRNCSLGALIPWDIDPVRFSS